MIELKIDPEFRDKIPPLTDAEFEQLRENILADGEVYEPIAVWNSIIVDGHNRWKIIQEHPEISYKIKEMDFADKWEAFEWMYRKQLGRRNLTEQQKAYMIGKMYEARKNTQGGDRRSENFSNGQNVHLKDRRETKDGTSGEIGKEFGIDGKTVRRAEHFAKGLDAIREVSPVAADKVLSGKSGASKQIISDMRTADVEELKAVAKAIEENKPVSRKQRPMSPQMKDFTKKMLDVVADMETTDKPYGLDDAICELNGAEDVFFTQIRFILEVRKDVITADERGKEQIAGFIDSVIHDLNELKGEI